MSEEYYTIRQGNGLWGDIEMRVGVYAQQIKATEIRRNPRSEEELEGRTITIFDTVKFLRALGVKSEIEFDIFMTNLGDKLDIDYLQRRCEYKGIRYEITGKRLTSVWRNYIKKCRANLPEAIKYIQGEECAITNEDEAVDRLRMAADVLIPEACGWIAKYLSEEGEWIDAAEYALRGTELKDGLSFYMLGVYYATSLLRPNYEAAVECFVKAAEKGIPEAVEELHKLIEKGKISDDNLRYADLLAIYSRKK